MARSSSTMTWTFQAPPMRSSHFWVAAAEEWEMAMQVRPLSWWVVDSWRRARKVFWATIVV